MFLQVNFAGCKSLSFHQNFISITGHNLSKCNPTVDIIQSFVHFIQTSHDKNIIRKYYFTLAQTDRKRE